MGCRKEKSKSKCKKNCSCKKDCLCRILKKFKHSEVTIRTKSGDFFTGELQRVTSDCCVKIIEPVMVSPFVNERLTVIRCKDIESFSVDLLSG
ncbi:hypothetical protein KW850_02190 [Bacillus sp. sid0103]|uniref:hypothetical protein n=1 Tax=Bacillus sp. sid0103 TaxID=2856337 RepID=UPI001C47525A|nr:hypothetical protein [Bacillus sp. sid0103]MBV7504075.1 hypothetical protein [Bacillus sp. sid0103]